MATPAEFQSASEKISGLAREKYGTDPVKIRRSIEFFVSLNEDREKAKLATGTLEGYFANPVDDETIRRFSVHGTQSDIAKQLEEYFDAGADTAVLVIGSHDQS
jgi:alkanesulfonate monooxygenase SsuD/methylene tetrahydromethanopterin reductase-like flavin-dependent oxidoreductase (luciferase family)